MQGGTAAVERVFREEYGRLIASLVRRFGDIDIAVEAAGEALVAALEKWPESGVPPNPGGWLTTTAINPPGRYQILAAINAVQPDAPTASDTDWSQVSHRTTS